MKRFGFFCLFFLSSYVFAESIQESYRPYITADFIYWKARMDGLEYVVTGIGSPQSPSEVRGRVYNVDFDGHLGFKVGLGLKIGHDGWDVNLGYTWLHSKESDHFHGEGGQELTQVPFLQGGVTRGALDWDFHMNVIDLALGRHILVSKLFDLRPFFGLKGYWASQDYRAVTQGLIALDKMETGSSQAHLDDENWGVGIRGGLETTFVFTKNWSFFGNIALAAEWSRFHFRVKQDGTFNEPLHSVSLVHLNDHQYQMIPVLELSLGIRWGMDLFSGSSRVSLQVAWEEQMWWDYAHSFDFLNKWTNGGNLNFQGLTIRGRFDF